MSADDWPHDPDGEQGSEGRRQYGHAVLAKKIDDSEDFPLRAGEYVDEFGDHPVRLDEETVVSVADIFAEIDDDREFADFVEFHRVVGRAMREGGFWTYEGSEAFA
ncbi:MAG: hypothetical protein J07HB67_00941 [halophilic archaeon J07HB67]|jgi:hypothetical protein|nr:MAG: hypothetical protein J07HB67_00941 [halophilic archaeon J07HB67]